MMVFDGTPVVVYANDPMWVEVKEKGVPGPPEGGGTAPLLKGTGPDLVFKPGDAPLPPGWFPEGASSSTPPKGAGSKEVDKKLETS